MSPLQIVVLLLAAIGVFFLLVSAIGILRFHGVHARMQAASVGGTLGIMTLLVSAGLYYHSSQELWRMLVLIILFAGTGPIATTAMARAAYRKAADINRFVALDEMASAEYVPDYATRDALPADNNQPAVRVKE